MIEKLIKGDCLEYINTMDDGSVDLIVTDPPYLVQYVAGRRVAGKKNKFSSTDEKEFHKFGTAIAGDDDPELISNYIKECYRILKNNSALYMFCNSNKVAFFVNELEKYFTMRNIIVWKKNSHSMGDLKHAFGKKYEFIILVNKGEAKIRGKRLTDVWEYDRVVGKSQLHQNQKPVPLLKQCIMKHSDEGDVVFDGFGGSGSTAVAARECGRGFIVIEKDDEYFAVAEKRLAEKRQDLLDF